VAKALRDFARTNPSLVIKGGVMDDRALSAGDARALADVEPREVLLARLAGAFAAPMQQFAGLLQALPRNFAYGLQALIDQGGDQGGAAAAPADTNDTTEES
jgi:large subunit ribosomal protein L10